jgi:REP element-mobilizing transposase RayT
MPADLREAWVKLLAIEYDRERRTQIEAWLDLGHGACHLKNEPVSQVVAEAFRHFDGNRYRLLAWTIMPNHVHVLFEAGETPMAEIVWSWMKFTARQANTLLGRTGPFWQADYWDSYMRDAEHEGRTIRYIPHNSVKAGLVADLKGLALSLCAS